MSSNKLSMTNYHITYNYIFIIKYNFELLSMPLVNHLTNNLCPIGIFFFCRDTFQSLCHMSLHIIVIKLVANDHATKAYVTTHFGNIS